MKERKVRSVTEKFYALNEGAEKLSQEDWTQLSIKQKLNYVSNYQLALLSQYQNYLNSLDEEERLADLATFSFIDLTLTTNQFKSFENELNDLIIKYYNMADSSKETETKTIAINIIPKP